MPTAAMSQSSRKMISPAYMLPKSRSECDSGFETYSTMLKRKLSGQSSGFEPKGAQKSSWMKPPTPFTVIGEADHQRPHGEREREGGVHIGRGHDAEAVLDAERAGE